MLTPNTLAVTLQDSSSWFRYQNPPGTHLPNGEAHDHAHLEQPREIEVHRFQTGEILFQGGDKTGPVLLLMRGRVQLFAEEGSLPTPLSAPRDIVESGNYLNIAAHFLEPSRYFMTARALEPGQVMLMDKTLFTRVLQDSPETQRDLLTQMAYELKERTVRLQQEPWCASCRVIHYFLERVPGDRRDAPFTVHLETKRREIAVRLDIREETLSRILTQLEKDGLLFSLERTAISVPKAEQLHARLLACPRCRNKRA
ncbi:MAG: Crp/Fnr family transcriptional regulator [Magnetococcales bacterium]|nr:Crp/Fnr family transcriptional regulator [Magnetococcales bacterium]